MSYAHCTLLVCLLHAFVVDIYASVGDRSLSFRKCFRTCEADCSPETPGTCLALLESSPNGDNKPYNF